MRRLSFPGWSLFLIVLLAFGACGPGEQTVPDGEPVSEPVDNEAAVAGDRNTRPAAGDSEVDSSTTGVPMVQISNARMPLPGVLTGGQPSPQQLEAIAAAGYQTVVNLRTEGEEGNWNAAPTARELGLEYIQLPIAGGDDLDVDDARRLEELLTDEELFPMVIHCGSGNRVGALFAMHAFHMRRASAEEALQVGRDAGMTRLEDTVRELLVQ